MELYIGLTVLVYLFLRSNLIGGLVGGIMGQGGSGGAVDAGKAFQGIRGGGGLFGPYGTDTLFQQALDRIVREGLQGNPFSAGISDPFSAAGQGNLAGVDANIGRLNQLAGGIRGDVMGSALASTRGSQIQALQAARMAGGGRGGLAFGGGASALAARAGQQAGTQQSAALAQALLSGSQLQGALLGSAGQLGLGAAQGRLGIAQGLSQANAARAQLHERPGARLDEFQLAQLQNIYGLGSSLFGQGLVGNAQRRAGIVGGSGLKLGPVGL